MTFNRIHSDHKAHFSALNQFLSAYRAHNKQKYIK